MQTGSSLLRMFLKKVSIEFFKNDLQIYSKFIISFQADKGNQVQAQPQAFFLPLCEAGEEGGGPVIDLEDFIQPKNCEISNLGGEYIL